MAEQLGDVVVTIPTVAGAVEPAELGRTLMHEHIFVVDPELSRDRPGEFDEPAEIERARRSLRELKASGFDTLVDMTVIGLGRDVDRVRRAVEGTGMNVIVATGIYTFGALPNYFRARGPGTANGGEDPVLEMLLRDTRVGIGGTGVRAGVLKCVIDAFGATPDVERSTRAVGRAHRAVGTPISTHSHAPSRSGLVQQDLLASEGVDLGRVLIGHCDDTDDLDYLTRLIERGSYLGVDRFGLETIRPDADRVRTVAELCRRGYAERLVLSHDASCFTMNYPTDTRQRVLPNWRHGAIGDTFIPALLAAGVTDDQVERMLRGNPAAFLGRTDPY
ncbi:phosphotriesterase family protein [Pseudonocardia acaciae]|uniref:phosphotriesterase family protein n=1 Tax=Pseudonocardia acaciae TaxID=551276 RepID=UPI00048BCB7F|nr:phosphotriesterase [Pseudonocardia acaciae]